MSPGKTSLAALLSVICLGASARAQSPVPEVMTVDEKSFATWKSGETILVVELPLRVELSRDESSPLPPCAELDSRLSRIYPRMKDCLGQEPVSQSCIQYRNLVNSLRNFGPLPPGGPLIQGWVPRLKAATLSPDMKAKLAAGLRVDESKIAVVTELSSKAEVRNLLALPGRSGTSWASRLAGFVDLNQPAVKWRPEFPHVFVTEDHLVACGLLEGDVSLEWLQDLKFRGATQGGALDADELWKVRERLLESGAIPAEPELRPDVWTAVVTGARIGKAIQELGEPGAADENKIKHVLMTLFDPELKLRSDVTKESLPGQKIVVEQTYRLNGLVQGQ